MSSSTSSTGIQPTQHRWFEPHTPAKQYVATALGIIAMIGALVATGMAYSSMGSAAFTFLALGLTVGLIPIGLVLNSLRKGRPDKQPIERPVIRLNYTDAEIAPAELRAQEKQRALGMSDFSTIDPAVVQRVREETFPPYYERAIGALLGMAVGDAVGAPYEFLPFCTLGYRPDEKNDRFNLAPGQWTDDASMGLCLADTLLAYGGELNETQLMWAFYDWWHHGYNNAFTQGEYRNSIGLGGNIGEGLEAFKRLSLERSDVEERRPTEAGDEFTSGNGSLMRLAPVALVACTQKQVQALARRQSYVTHRGDEAAECCALMAWIIYLAIHSSEENPVRIKNEIYLALKGYKCEVPSVQALARGEEAENPKTRQQESWNWLGHNFSFNAERVAANPGYIGSYAMDALAMALHCIYTTESFESAVKKAATRGGDADTVGAITGQIAGAIYGRAAIPTNWVEDVQRWDRGGEIAARACLLMPDWPPL